MDTTPSERGASLRVTRDNAWYGRWRKLRVLLDDAEIGRLANGETKVFDIAAGSHELVVRMDWVRSEPVSFDCDAEDELEATCASPRMFRSFSLREILFTSAVERASRPYTITVTRRGDDSPNTNATPTSRA
jgi:hypothetical protein